MEPNNRWLIAGVAAVILGFAYIYIKHRQTPAAATPSVVVSGTPPTDLSTVGNIPGTGFNMGDYTGSGFNGLGAAGSPLSGTVGIGSQPLEIAPGITLASTGLTLAQWQALTGPQQQLVIAHFSNPANQHPVEGGPGMAFQPAPTSTPTATPTVAPPATATPLWNRSYPGIPVGTGPGGQGRVVL